MKTVSDFLEEAKKKTGSDYATAKAIGMTRAGVSKARKNDILSNEYAVKLAGLIDVDPGEIIAAADVKAHPENEEIWKRWVAAAAIMAAILTGSFTYSSNGYAANLIENNYTLCAVWSGAGKTEIQKLPGY